MKMIFYGTLQRGGWNHHRLGPHPAFIRKDAFKGQLYWSRPGGIPFAKAEGDSEVHGELYEVPSTFIDGLDALEGHPRWYRRTAVQLLSGEEAVAYIYQGSVVGMQRVPDGRYPINAG